LKGKKHVFWQTFRGKKEVVFFLFLDELNFVN